MPPAAEGGTGFDRIEGWADIDNKPSRRNLEKCGFTLCEILPDPDNTLRGPSAIARYCRARHGKTLEELGLTGSAESSPPTPPVQ